jgi:hypothetical protein
MEIYVGRMVLRGRNFEYITDCDNTKKLIFGGKRCREEAYRFWVWMLSLDGPETGGQRPTVVSLGV